MLKSKTTPAQQPLDSPTNSSAAGANPGWEFVGATNADSLDIVSESNSNLLTVYADEHTDFDLTFSPAQPNPPPFVVRVTKPLSLDTTSSNSTQLPGPAPTHTASLPRTVRLSTVKDTEIVPDSEPVVSVNSSNANGGTSSASGRCVRTN
ncbi:hypothetical protein OF83DRAFT_239976 [Amylostereum chailletii]|nr:hypothetical protein OF83DRAFT_239976 [Amylostereum chailletii]